MKQQIRILLAGFCLALFFNLSLSAQCEVTAFGGTITCVATSITLQASSTTPNITYAWSGPSGFNSTLQNPVVSDAGVYTVTISDGTGCTATSLAMVNIDAAVPDIAATTTGIINCANPEVVIVVSSGTPGNFCEIYGPNGFSQQGFTALVNQQGTYTVVVTNPVNGCTAVADVPVIADITIPTISILPVNELSCSQPFTVLTASVSPPNSGITVLWTGASITSQGNVVTVTQPGIYCAIATGQNGCTSTQCVTVSADNSFINLTADVTNAGCSGSATGAIDLTATGGSGIYTYQWALLGTTFTSTSQDISGLQGGNYSVTVTDNAGCSTVGSFFVNALPPILININGVVLPNCFGANDGMIFANTGNAATNMTYIWSTPNGVVTSTVTANLANLGAGAYQLTATNALGCSAVSGLITIVQPAQLTVLTDVVSTDCSDATIIASVSGGSAPYTFTWSNGSTFPNITTVITGQYTLTITDANGCTVTSTVGVQINNGLCAAVKGTVFYDENENCTIENTETGLGGWLIKASNATDTAYAATQNDGSYLLHALTGTYNLEALAPNGLWILCQNNLPVTLNSTSDTAQVDFQAQADSICPLLTVDITSSNLRRCFTTNHYAVGYCNEGTQDASDAYIEILLDPLETISASNKIYTALGNDLYRFEVGDIAINECGNFWFQVNISCNAILGQTLCASAHIYPDTSCVQTGSNWSGASVGLNALCDGDSIRFSIQNQGTADMTNQLEYIVIEDGVMLRNGNTAPLQTGGEMLVSVPANGSTWRIETNQEPNHPFSNIPSASVEGCTVTGTFTTGFVTQFSINEQFPYEDTDCRQITGSYDPNDKQGIPIGYGSAHYVYPETEIEYQIRFQNTGNDTAFTVVIRDTLSTWFDPETVRQGASSHPYKFEMYGGRELIFTFENILLPDSFVNEPASHGFVQFKVSPRASTPLETDVQNTAAIYFDFNNPIFTNTTTHRIGKDFILLANKYLQNRDKQVFISPNPAPNAAKLSLSNFGNAEPEKLILYSLEGRNVAELNAIGGYFELNKISIPSGIYLAKVIGQKGELGFGKLIVE